MCNETGYSEVHRNIAADDHFIVKFLNFITGFRCFIPAGFELFYNRVKTRVTIVQNISCIALKCWACAPGYRRTEDFIFWVKIENIRNLVEIEARTSPRPVNILRY